jgi:hypothetical protein
MPYPAISHYDARRWWAAWKAETEHDRAAAPPPAPEPAEREAGDAHDWTGIAEGLAKNLGSRLAAMADRGGRDAMSAFEATAAPEVHAALPRDAALADPEFWIWLAIGPGLPMVRERYNSAITPGCANFTSPQADETLFRRLWLRAEMAHDPMRDDPYEIAQYGDIDFWRSHVFRQKYAEYRGFVEAFARFQYPDGPSGQPRVPLKNNQKALRAFVKRLRRLSTNLMVEWLTVEEALELMEREWEKMREESSA